MIAELIVLRLVHVIGGIIWVGFATYNTFFLMPTLAGMGPAAGPVAAGLQQRHLFTLLPAVATLTVLAGLRLLWIASGGLHPAYFMSGPGLGFAVGGALGLLGFAVGMVHTRPTMARATALMAERAGAPPERQAAIDAQVGRLRAAGTVSGLVNTWAVLGAAVGMAVARYL